MKKDRILSAEETLKIIAKPWATTDDIMKIGAVGMNKALSIKKELLDKSKNGLIPMDVIVEYFNINIKYLKEIVNEEVSI